MPQACDGFFHVKTVLSARQQKIRKKEPAHEKNLARTLKAAYMRECETITVPGCTVWMHCTRPQMLKPSRCMAMRLAEFACCGCRSQMFDWSVSSLQHRLQHLITALHFWYTSVSLFKHWFQPLARTLHHWRAIISSLRH